MQTGAQRASIILGVFMAVVMIGGVIVPLLGGNNPTSPSTSPTDAPVPTFPPPISDLTTVSFDEYYLHPTGLFMIAQPTGYEVSQPTSAPTIAQVNMVNSTALSVIDAYVEDPGAPITADALDARFDQATLAQSWSRFNSWEELSRRMDGDTLLIDFQVELQNQIYVARQKVWTDGDWIFVVRVLAPDNATDFLVATLNALAGTMQPFKAFAGTPFDWQAYYDHLLNHIIRYPSGWSVTDSAPGRPASITGTAGELLRVEAQANTTVADAAAAQGWVESQRSGATVLSAAPVTRDDSSGFAVAYTFSSVDGDPQSGLAVLLNGSDGTLHVANLRFPAENVDLNSVQASLSAAEPAAAEATAQPDSTALQYGDLALAMSTFRLMPPLNLSAASLPQATPTPLPTAAPVETTAEATAEAAAEALTEEAEATENVVTFDQLASTAAAVAEQAPTARP
jgi:hypothetical protein